MGNPITNTLPDDIDNFLQDLSQIEGLFSYNVIMDFGEVYINEDIIKLRKIEEKISELVDKYDEYENIPKKMLETQLKKAKAVVIGRINKFHNKLPSWKKDIWRK